MLTPNHTYRTDRDSTYTVSYSGVNALAPGSGPVGSCITYYDNLVINSTNTPGFAKLPKRLRPFHAYSKSSVVYTDGPTTMTQSYRSDAGDIVGDFVYSNFNCYLNGAYAFRFSVPADDVYQKLVAKIQSEIRLGQTNLGVTLAEANKTAAMVASTAIRVAGAIKALRRADLVGFSTSLGLTITKKQKTRFFRRKRLEWVDRPVKGTTITRQVVDAKKEKFARDTWLEYTYGWMPLLSDIHSSAKALATLTVDPSVAIRRVDAKAMVESDKSRIDALRNVSVKTEMNVKTYGAMTVNYRIPDGVSFGDAMGLNNPLLVAWELVPFSFVVDWFLPIGTALESLTAYSGLTFVSGSYQRRVIVREKVTCSPGSSWRAGNVVWGPQSINCSLNLESVNISRSLLGSFPTYGWPTFKSPASVKHAISSIALLSSIFRK